MNRDLLEEYARRERSKAAVSALTAAVRSEYFDRQRAFVEDKNRNKLALCTRRAGKTNIWPRYTVSEALERPGVLIRVWAVNRLRAKQLLWDEYNALFRRHGIEVTHTGYPQGSQVKMHETELTLRFGNGSEIRLLGADKDKEVQKKRGDKTWMEIVIESQLFGPYLKTLVEEVAEPCLFDLRGTFCLEGTPGPVCAGYWYETSGRNDLDRRWVSSGGKDSIGAGWSCHRWSVLDNPFLPHAKSELAALKKKRRWDDDNPTFLREWTARWVNDVGALFYKYAEDRNTYDSTVVQPWGPGWQHVLGWDLGSCDDMALVAWGWHPKHPDLYEAFSWKKPGALAGEVMEQILALEGRGFNFIAKVADTGGGGRMYVEEVMSRYAQVFEPAKKSEKAEHVRLMNDDYITGRIKLRLGSPLQEEVAALTKDPDWDSTSGRPPLENPRAPNHCADASLYSWRRAYGYLYAPEPTKPVRGTVAWNEQQEEEYVRRLSEGGARQRPWWDAVDDGEVVSEGGLDG